MSTTQQDLNTWLAKIQQASSPAEVLKLVDEFRTLPWSDEQRATVAKAYVPKLENLNANRAGSRATSVNSDSNSDPTWYEKM